jgi:hypothetical protein
LSLAGFLTFRGIGPLAGMPYVGPIMAFGTIQVGLVSWVTKEQEKKQ